MHLSVLNLLIGEVDWAVRIRFIPAFGLMLHEQPVSIHEYPQAQIGRFLSLYHTHPECAEQDGNK
jgi:hypothetical protein